MRAMQFEAKAEEKKKRCGGMVELVLVQIEGGVANLCADKAVYVCAPQRGPK